MITKTYIQTMARYNCWQNQSLFREAEALGDDERRKERGAFFGSIHRTLSHIIWGDMMWMHRFTGSPTPENLEISESGELVTDWQDLKSRRTDLDAHILKWADGVTEDVAEGDLTWFSGAMGREVSKPKGFLITHFFNHQTHHRGQIHAMITAAGGKPDDTDLFFMVDDVEHRAL